MNLSEIITNISFTFCNCMAGGGRGVGGMVSEYSVVNGVHSSIVTLKIIFLAFLTTVSSFGSILASQTQY